MSEYITIHMTKVENGYVVTINHPERMTAKPDQGVEILGSILGEMASGGVEGIADKLKTAVEEKQKADKEKPLRKPVEDYVFTTIGQALGFIKEVMDSDK